MRTLTKFLSATAAFALLAPAAHAATIFPGNPTMVPDAFFNVSGDINSGPISATFGRSGLPAGTFTDEFVFTIDQIGFGSGSITSILAGNPGGTTDLDFLSVTFDNGSGPIVVPITDFGFQESGGLANVPISFGVQNTLSVTYLSRGNGSFGGNLAFDPIPEPATWGMMLLGFGAMGAVMRRRRKQEAKVSYAF